VTEPPPPHRPIDVAYTLHIRGLLPQAEAHYRQIIADDPTGAEGMDGRNNLLGLLQSQRRWADARLLIQDALAARPENGDWAFRMGGSLLRDGCYAEAWPWFEARRRVTRNRVATPPMPFPEWLGEPIKSLVVWPEQGFGDVIQFSRYLPLLRERGIEVTLVCRPALTRLLEPLVDRCVASGPEMRLPMVDAWCLIGSLPLRFGTTMTTIPPAALASIDASRGGIGIASRGSPTHFNDANRSLPAEFAAELLTLPGAISLAPEDSGAMDFADTASLIAGLDLVISVDTAVAHLAGSMGKPVWVLLPYLNTDWRWLAENLDSPWYPSARLFRQPAAGDWTSVLDAVRAALATR
jgi:Glycosyltransferase family 9 (heptosyltransferase)